MAIIATLTKVLASTATTGKKVLSTASSVAQKSIGIVFNNTTMFVIIFGYLVFTAISGGHEIWKSCLLASLAGGGIIGLAFIIGTFWIYLSAGVYIAYKVVVAPYAVIYQNIISVSRLEHIVPSKYVPIAQRIGTLEPYVSLVSNLAFIFLIIAIIKHDKQWMYRAGKVLVILILFGLAANADVFFYQILFSFRDFIHWFFTGG